MGVLLSTISLLAANLSPAVWLQDFVNVTTNRSMSASLEYLNNTNDTQFFDATSVSLTLPWVIAGSANPQSWDGVWIPLLNRAPADYTIFSDFPLASASVPSGWMLERVSETELEVGDQQFTWAALGQSVYRAGYKLEYIEFFRRTRVYAAPGGGSGPGNND